MQTLCNIPSLAISHGWWNSCHCRRLLVRDIRCDSALVGWQFLILESLLTEMAIFFGCSRYLYLHISAEFCWFVRRFKFVLPSSPYCQTWDLFLQGSMVSSTLHSTTSRISSVKKLQGSRANCMAEFDRARTSWEMRVAYHSKFKIHTVIRTMHTTW